jgi:membrane associated rhomboid family serine protease
MSPSSDRSTIGRGSAHAIPWVTFVLIAVCVFVFSLTQQASSQVQAAAERGLQSAIDYLLEHPYLEPGSVLSERVNTDNLEQKRARQRLERARRGAPPIPKRVQQRQQEQLEQLVEEAFAGVSNLPSYRWGFRATEFDPLTLVTHVYLHESSLHLLGALFLLLILGFELENAWGGPLFALFVLLASAASATAYAIGNSEFSAPLIGLSGVLSALLAAFLIQLRSTWKQPVYLFTLVVGGLFLILPARSGHEWSVSAGLEQRAVLAVYQGASYWALGGGFVFGLLAQLVVGLFKPSESGAGAGTRRSGERVAKPLLERAMSAQSAGKPNEAYGTLAELLRQNPDDHEALLLMCDVALDYGRPADAATAMLRAIRDEVKRGDDAAAVEHWLQLGNRGLQADAEPALLIRLALMLQQQAHSFAAIEALQQALQRSEGPNAAVVASRVARASRDLDVDTARAAAWRALGFADLDLEERQSLESLLAEIGPGIEMDRSASAGDGREVDVEFEEEDAVGGIGEAVAREEPEVWVDPALVDEDAGSYSRGAGKMETVELEDVVRVGDGPPRAAGARFNRPAPIDLDVASRSIRTVGAIPIARESGALVVEFDGGAKRRIPLEKLEAISVAAVGGLSEKPVILIDLVTNWKSAADEPLKVVRIRGDRFDARAFSDGRGAALDALRAFVGGLLRECGAKPLPDEQSANGLPFASFDDLTSYQRHVLGVEEDDPPAPQA